MQDEQLHEVPAVLPKHAVRERHGVVVPRAHLIGTRHFRTVNPTRRFAYFSVV